MTPRERLKAAGWKPWRSQWVSPDGVLYSELEALAQLARDEAKETSDGDVADNDRTGAGRDNCDADRDLGAVKQTAPVAGSISAPDIARAKEWWANNSHRLINADNWWDMEQCLAEYASSSSAALQSQLDIALQELARRDPTREAATALLVQRAEAAEVKCAELQREAVQQGRILSELRDELRQTKKLKDTALATHDELRDSRDRLQEALREKDVDWDKLVEYWKNQAEIARAALNPVPDTE